MSEPSAEYWKAEAMRWRSITCARPSNNAQIERLKDLATTLALGRDEQLGRANAAEAERDLIRAVIDALEVAGALADAPNAEITASRDAAEADRDDLAAQVARLTAERDEAFRRRDEWRKKAEGYDAVCAALREKVGEPWPPSLSRALWAGLAAAEKSRADALEAQVEKLRAVA